MGRFGFKALAAGLAVAVAATLSSAAPQSTSRGVHLGVASCAGSTCHGRGEATGAVVRQNELLTWQDESSPAGAHVRAYRVLSTPRSQQISQRLGMGRAESAPVCLSCHADAPPMAQRGPRFDVAEGVGCESCHGGASGWIASHAAGASHADNIARGLVALDRPRARADNCLDCHFGAKGQQFVTHRIMAAGHPRISFELDLFTALQRHHDEDADYAKRKTVAPAVKVWAVGQAMAVGRALDLYATPGRAEDGAFPEFVFYDCRTCHRSFADGPAFRSSYVARPTPPGMPTFNDENMLMLAAAAKVTAPALAQQFTQQSRAFHAAFVTSRAAAATQARTLSATADRLAATFESRAFTRGETLAMLREVLTGATTARYTDYQGGAQAVMAADTLIGALVEQGALSIGTAKAMRPDLDRAYAAVRDANAWRPDDVRRAFSRIAAALPGA